MCAWQTAPPGAAQQAAQDFLLRIQLPSQRDQQPQVGRASVITLACRPSYSKIHLECTLWLACTQNDPSAYLPSAM